MKRSGEEYLKDKYGRCKKCIYTELDIIDAYESGQKSCDGENGVLSIVSNWAFIIHWKGQTVESYTCIINNTDRNAIKQLKDYMGHDLEIISCVKYTLHKPCC